MNKNTFAIVILIVCLTSLCLGFFTNNINKVQQTPKNEAIGVNFDLFNDKIALLTIDGVITGNSNPNYFSSEFNLDNFLTSLEKIQNDNTVKAVIIRINSPGGTVAASQDIYDAVLRLRKIKPVVVSMGDVAASGGYYIASAGDRIVAQKGTMTGSIGVILNFTEISDLTKKLGIYSEPIKSGKFKDAGSMYRKMSNDEHILFQNSVNNAYKQFVQAITDARVNRNDSYKVDKKELSLNTLKKYADGRVFLGEEAYNLGFIDKIGSKYEAQKLASEMAGYTIDLPIVNYGKQNNLVNFVMGMESIFNPNNIKNILPLSLQHSKQPLMVME